MSLNTSHTPDGNGVLIFNGELIHLYVPAFTLEIGENQNENIGGKHAGELYLTSHRIIFKRTPFDPSTNLKTLDVPFALLREVKLEQPIFGSNYIHGKFVGGNLRGEVPFKMVFNKGGCIDFGLTLLQIVDRVDSLQRPSTAPPPYAPPAGAYFSAPPDYYTPNAANPANATFATLPNCYGTAPPPEAIFMSEAPPPYPGVGEDRAPQPTEELRRAGETAAPPPYTSGDASGLRQRRN